MKTTKRITLILTASLIIAACGAQKKPNEVSDKTKHQAVTIETPDQAITELKNGNDRFIANKLVNTDYKTQIENTKSDQHPHSVILSCLDSRVPPEIIFDQGIGAVFVARNAGNIEDLNILGSLEFATKVKETKLIVVMGHNHCGAVKGAVDGVELGNLTQLVNQIKPAIIQNDNKETMIDQTSKNSIKITIADILRLSPIISELVKEGKVKIVGAYYDLTTGKVIFLD